MSKYNPLEIWLEQTDDDLVPMGFSEIENVLGFELPPSSRTQRAWWSNNPSNNVMTRAWLEAGYETANVDMEGEKLVFKRMKTSVAPPVVSAAAMPRRHPLFGIMKGMLTLSPDLDLTQPADPDLADFLDIKYGPDRA